MAVDSPGRRQFLIGTAASPFLAALPAAAQAPAGIAEDLHRYIGFGGKQAGGAGDTACGAWLEAELSRAGFRVARQGLSVPFFEPERCALVAGAARAPVWPQPIVRPTGDDGIAAPLVCADRVRPLAGTITLVELPHGRWSSALTPRIRGAIDGAFAAGSRAVILVTNGPTGKVIALNADGRAPLFAGPVAVLAPEAAGPFLAAAARGERATLYLTGRGGRRPAFNLIGRIDRGAGRWLVVSTPRSGWFACAGERGGGVAAWLSLARWAGAAMRDFDLAFICNSGHEYEYLGAEEMLREAAPGPAQTAFWLHLGANLAARDWHEGVAGLLPLPSSDPQRYLAVSRSLLPAARREFAGLAGLEAPYAADELAAGELTNIVRAGYPSVAGVFGLHRFHHVAEDDARCVSAEEIGRAAAAFRGLLEQALV